MGTEPAEEDLDRNFHIMDEDESGDINQAEAIEYLKGFRLGHELKELINRADSEGGGSNTGFDGTPLSTLE